MKLYNIIFFIFYLKSLYLRDIVRRSKVKVLGKLKIFRNLYFSILINISFLKYLNVGEKIR